MLPILDAVQNTADGEPFEILLPLGLILILAKLLSTALAKFKIPQVIGFLFSGLLIGLLYFIPGETVLTDYTRGGIDILAKIGVVLILFSAGVETDLKQIKAVGKSSVVITGLGVLMPLLFGFLAAFLFRVYGGMDTSYLPESVDPVYGDLYYGVILTATSVSITVATLKELGKLEGKVGSALISAAILDDIIGIVLLSLIISLSGSSTSDGNLLEMLINACGGTVEGPWTVVVIVANMAIFFGLSFGAYFIIKPIFNYLDAKFPHHRRIPIFGLAFCFVWAYLSQEFFQIADITGAYIAGLLLSLTKSKEYIDHRTETTANVMFVPVFFASVALKMYDASFDFSDFAFIGFGLLYVVLGVLGKIVGAGSGAKMCRYSLKDSLRIGIGMMARAEVLIVTAQTGVDVGLVSPQIIPFCLLLILLTSFLTPIFLKLLYRNENGGASSAKAEVEGGSPSN